VKETKGGYITNTINCMFWCRCEERNGKAEEAKKWQNERENWNHIIQGWHRTRC